MRKRAHPEDTIQRNVCDHLRGRASPGVVWWHTPNGAQLAGDKVERAKTIARLKTLCFRNGVADLVLFHKGKLYCLELKAPRGNVTEDQLKFLSDADKAGAFTCLAHGERAAIQCLESWGLLKGRAQ